VISSDSVFSEVFLIFPSFPVQVSDEKMNIQL